jgi:hypothetical protein
MGFLFLFGMFVFLLVKQQTAAVNESNIARDEDMSGRILPGGLKQIGFEYNSTDEDTSSSAV